MELEEILRDDALRDQEAMINKTYLCFWKKSYIVSIILMLFNNSNVYNNILNMLNYNIFIYLGISILILSLFSVYDVIESLFTLNIVRYEIAKNSINEESK